jgi:cytochrome c oxidase cbb3-type subunit 3
MPTKIEKDSVTGTETTGHEWDGLKELNTPLPKWWVYTWLVTIVWGAIWCFLYPSFPIPFTGTYWHGVLGASTRANVERDVRVVSAQRAGVMDRVAKLSFEQIRADPELLEAAMTSGHITFANNCQACHGAGGAGAVGYPSLAAGAWIWGGKVTDIQTTLLHGVRSGDPAARGIAMPRFGADGILKPVEIEQLADYVVATFYGTPRADAPASDVKAGAALYATNCAACHGETGKGNRILGAPMLASKVHLYGNTRAVVVQQITAPKLGVMPAWNTRLDAATIKSVALYVHDLGGGE